MYVKILTIQAAVLPLAVLGMGRFHPWGFEHAPEGIDEVDSGMATATTTTTTTVEVSPQLSTSTDCNPGWQHWSYSSTSTSTSTLVITVTAWPSSLEPAANTTTAASTSTVPQSPTITLGTNSSQTQPPNSTPSSSAANASLCAPQSYTPILSPYWNQTGRMLNATQSTKYFGFNVVNTKPFNVEDSTQSSIAKSPADWESDFALLKRNFPLINTVRMYSTTDGPVTHLMNAMPGAQNHDLMIMVGICSGGIDRFGAEMSALKDVIIRYGCGNMAAISVGNEDIYSVNTNNPGLSDAAIDQLKNATAWTLIDQIQAVRSMTRELGCCDVPITHTDTWGEFANTSKTYIPKLLDAIDEAAIVNIFPYWSEIPIEDAHSQLDSQYTQAMNQIAPYGKDIWLGETGWAYSQPSDSPPFNKYGTNTSDAQQYFEEVGCGILSGDLRNAFYYADWDQDAPTHGNPAFGLFQYNGLPIFEIFDCTDSQRARLQSAGNSSTTSASNTATPG